MHKSLTTCMATSLCTGMARTEVNLARHSFFLPKNIFSMLPPHLAKIDCNNPPLPVNWIIDWMLDPINNPVNWQWVHPLVGCCNQFWPNEVGALKNTPIMYTRKCMNTHILSKGVFVPASCSIMRRVCQKKTTS